MSYQTHAAICTDYELRLRITAAAALEGADDPTRWVNATIWHLPGTDWVAAYESALVGHDPDTIGADASIITDQMILSAVQHQMSSA